MKYSDDWVYDVECFPNLFTLKALSVKTGKIKTFEISPRRNHKVHLMAWVNRLAIENCRMVGFNNLHYDYPMLHYLMTVLANDTSATLVTKNLYNKSQAIFKDSNNPATKFKHTLWDNQHIVDQLDLFKVHHFDNPSRSTSLKRLQFNMRLKSIRECDAPFGEPVKKSSVIEEVLTYNEYDVVSTKEFLRLSKPHVDFREKLTEQFGMSFMNDNKTKIGEKYLVNRLKEEVGEHVLFTEDEEGKRKKLTTERKVIPVSDLIFDCVKFERPEFNTVLNKLLGLKVFVVKGKFYWNEYDDYLTGVNEVGRLKNQLKKIPKDEKPPYKKAYDALAAKYADHHISCEVDGFTFEFGKGGLHGTLRGVTRYTNKKRIIIDLDVTSYYPNIGISYGLFPEHLTDGFCPVYSSIPIMRKKYAKGTPENGLFKEASNGSYGKTNSIYSHLCDPKYTIQTTINGQLLLCMLWEQMIKIPDTVLLQANTDGITIEINKTSKHKSAVKKVCRWWEKLTGLVLESAVYSRMWIRDGNNYLAEYMNGKVKQKGAYLYQSLFHDSEMDTSNIEWHKNHSMMVVQKAVEAELVHGVQASKFIIEHDDVFDFFLCTNVNRACKLYLGDGSAPAIKRSGKIIANAALGPLNKEIQRNSRYLISNSNDVLTKQMKPLTGKTHDRYIGINVGYNVSVYNDVESEKASDYDINYQFYIDEANKLLKPFK